MRNKTRNDAYSLGFLLLDTRRLTEEKIDENGNPNTNKVYLNTGITI